MRVMHVIMMRELLEGDGNKGDHVDLVEFKCLKGYRCEENAANRMKRADVRITRRDSCDELQRNWVGGIGG